MTVGEVREAIKSVSDDIECSLFAEGGVYPLLLATVDCDGKYFEFGGGWAELDTYKEFSGKTND